MSDDPLSVTGEKRLKLERERIDRQYNDALTALDHALQQFPKLPASPAAPDDSLITRLNELARLVPEGGIDCGVGWRGRIRRFVWQFIGPVFQRQHDFNLALIDHINRNVEPTRQRAHALDKVLTAIRDSFASQAFFQHKLMLYAQQITPYVNTKQPIMPLSVHEFGTGLAAGLDAVGDEILAAASDRHQRDDRCNADDHSEQREARTEFVGPDREPGCLQQSDRTHGAEPSCAFRSAIAVRGLGTRRSLTTLPSLNWITRRVCSAMSGSCVTTITVSP